MWDTIIGHRTEKEFLQNMLKGERKTPSLLFYGPEGIGKNKLARAFAKSFLCTEDPFVPCQCASCRAMDADAHPDFLEVEPAGKSKGIGVDAIHALTAQAAFGPRLSHYKVCLIDQAHTMREEAQNSLLKLLEEPPDYWLFLLVADQVEWLLPTIRSRLIELRFDPLSYEETEQVLQTITITEADRPAAMADVPLDAVQGRWRQQLPVLARLAGGSAGKALEWFRLDALTLREQILDLLEQSGRDDLLVYTNGLAWLTKNDRAEGLVLMELLLLILRDGLFLTTGLPQPLYNEDLRQRLGLFFADWTEPQVRRAMELCEGARQAIGSFVSRRLTLEGLFLEIHQLHS
ncbi:DNA polymerase III subunit [Acidaminococcus timonensis]|uniref:DNA polymerase III subunit n=1 Tax=Acidaminococcus timonensis TaxID=1871002 RepID=UPI0026EF1B3F|nr:DNA polymerase III subunit [Acidaminococcus timonensis]